MRFTSLLCRTLLMVALTATLPAVAVAASGIEYVVAEGKGSGETRAAAINEALAEAVAKVNGLSLSSQDVSALRIQLSSIEAQTSKGQASATSASIEEAKMQEIPPPALSISARKSPGAKPARCLRALPPSSVGRTPRRTAMKSSASSKRIVSPIWKRPGTKAREPARSLLPAPALPRAAVVKNKWISIHFNR